MSEAQVSTVTLVVVVLLMAGSSFGSASLGLGRPISVTGQLSKLGSMLVSSERSSVTFPYPDSDMYYA